MIRILADFAVGYILSIAAIAVLVFLASLVRVDLDVPATGMLAAIAASIYAGGRYAKRSGATVPKGQAWPIAFAAAGVMWALSVAQFVLLWGLESAAEPAGENMVSILLENPIIWGVMGLFFLITVVAVRFFFPFAARQALKKKAATPGDSSEA